MIQQNGTPSETHRPRLFHACSVLKQLPHHGVVLHDVVVRWTRGVRRVTERPYDKLITAYQQRDDLQRTFAEHFIDELFTPTEIKQLGTYLDLSDGRRLELSDVHSEKFIVQQANLPVTGEVTGYNDMPVGGLAGRFDLSTHRGYDLPFKVRGYFNLATGTHRYDVDKCTAYVHRVLQVLSLDKGVKKKQIEAVVDKLYQRDALFVTRDRTPKDWLHKIEL